MCDRHTALQVVKVVLYGTSKGKGVGIIFFYFHSSDGIKFWGTKSDLDIRVSLEKEFLRRKPYQKSNREYAPPILLFLFYSYVKCQFDDDGLLPKICAKVSKTFAARGFGE